MAKKLTQEEFLKQIYDIHGTKIDFSNAVYANDSTKIECKCNICGHVWYATPNNLKGCLNRKPKGCPKCSHKSDKYTLEEWLNKAHNVWGDSYDLSLIHDYNGQNQKMPIICKKHGIKYITSRHFLNGHGCNECAIEKNKIEKRKTFQEFAKEMNSIFGDKYIFHEDTYVNSHTDIKITCPIHGDFNKTPHELLSKKSGCPKCKQSKLENEVEIELLKNGINFEYRDRPKWLEGLELDFYIKSKNVAIECQGIQHYEPVEQFGGKKEFKNTVERDTRKAKLCEENGIKLFYFTHYANINEEGNIYKNKDKLLEEILHNA